MHMEKYRELFEPYRFRCGLTVANRIVIAPMTTWSSNPDGTIHNDELAYLRRRSHGFGLVITAACYVMPEGHAFHGQWGCHDDSMLPSLHRAAETIHDCGSTAILQLHHGGRMCPKDLLGHAPLCASAVPALRPDADVPREMTLDDIHRTIEAFGSATRRAIGAGYDGVEIHGANTYLLQQFFSPHSNRRTDDWGGSLERRMRFPLAVLRAVQDAASTAGRPFAVGYRLSPEEIEDPGITLEDTLVLIDALAERSPDWIHVSVREYFKGSIRNKAESAPPTTRIVQQLAGRTPVIGVGKVVTPEHAQAVCRDGCTLVAMARIVLTEPEWVEKVKNGKATSIRDRLPRRDGDSLLTLPSALYERLLSVKNWMTVDENS